MGFIRYIKNQFRHDRNMKRMLEELSLQQIEIQESIQKCWLDQKVNYLKEKIMTCKELGVTDEQICNEEVIVSFTSFGQRISEVSLVIESIMQGTVKPNRIVLWLSEEEFKGKTLPRTLEMQKSRGLQVEFCEDIRSYKKLIPSLKKYPESCIITIDDDAVYDYDLVERLVAAHREHSDAICACRMHKVKLGEDGKPLSYMDWDWCVEEYDKDSALLFPTGVGGILYPPQCFSSEVFKQEVFMDLCPHADDVWFYAMRLISGTPITQVYTGNPWGHFRELPSRNIGALSNENTDVKKCRNDVQIKAVMDMYDLYQYMLA